VDRAGSDPSEAQVPLEDQQPSSGPSLETRLSLFDRAERIGGLGSWEWTPETGELLWSDNHFRLFGREPGSFSPSPEFLVSHVHRRDRARVLEAWTNLQGGADPGTLDYRIVRADGAIRHIHMTIASVDGSDSGPPRFAGCVQDVTSERHVGRQLRAYAAVSHAVDDWEEFESGTRGLLAGLADAMDFSFGALWVPGRATLTVRTVWHRKTPALVALAAATKDWHPGRGSPVLGPAWLTGRPQVSPHPWAGAPPQRALAIRDEGLRTVVVVPAVVVDESLAILEFLSIDPVALSDQLVRALTGIGHEVGHFLAQHRHELVEPVLTPRERQVLQLTARAYSANEIAVALGISPATVKRHFESAYTRLGVSTRAAAVAEAMRQGSIT
jgi:DNA-binding CsgD family transcriptional regulator